MENESEYRSFHISALVKKYKEESLSTAEEVDLKQWRNENSQNEILFKELAGEYYITQQLSQFKGYDPEDALNRISQRIDLTERKQSVVRSLYFKIAAAAASVLLICFAYSNRDRIDNWLNPVHYEIAATLNGERKIVTLDDGTKIWLAPASLLTYPDKFIGKTREVKLVGEAFLEVHKDHSHPFIIHSGKIATTVLGTSFNLKAYTEEKNITVTLLTGKVSFSDGKQKVMLLPAQRAIYQKDKSNIIKEDYPDAQKMLERREGILEYNNTPVSEIVADLRRNYNMNIVIKGIAGCPFYGRMNKGESPEAFLNKLSIVIGANLNKKGNIYTISGGGCL